MSKRMLPRNDNTTSKTLLSRQLVLTFALLCMTSPMQAGADDNLCGPKCLLEACQRLEVSSSLDELSSMSDIRSGSGASLQGLATAAKKKGLECLVVKAGAEELAGVGCLAIAHLWTGHFVLVEAVGSQLRVVDPPKAPVLVPPNEFSAQYSGFALMLSKKPFSVPPSDKAQADLRIDKYEHDIGFHDEGELVQFSIAYRNVGKAPLVIANVHTSCGCMGATPSNTTLQPGESAELKLFVDTTSRSGAESLWAFIASNDPVSPVARLHVVGAVRPSRVALFPSMLFFGQVRSSASSECRTLIPSSQDPSSPNYSDVRLTVAKVSTDTACVQAAVEGNPGDGDKGITIVTKILPHSPLGELRGHVLVETNNPRNSTLVVPFRATVKGNIDLDHESFFLGVLKKGETRDTAVTVSTVSKAPLKITKVDNPLSCLAVDVKPKTEGREYVLTAALKPDAPAGNIKGDVIVHTNDSDQPQIKIPVYAYVEELK